MDITFHSGVKSYSGMMSSPTRGMMLESECRKQKRRIAKISIKMPFKKYTVIRRSATVLLCCPLRTRWVGGFSVLSAQVLVSHQMAPTTPGPWRRTKYSLRLQENYVLAVEAENTSMSKQIKLHPGVLYAVGDKAGKG